MNVVLLDLPAAPENADDEGFAFGGAQVVTAGFVQGLLECDAVSDVLVFAPASRKARFARRIAGYRHGERATLIDADELRTVAARSDFVLQGFTPSLVDGIHLRWLCGARWPVVGMTHDLSDQTVFRDLLLTAVGRPQPFDAVVCSTACAQGVLARLITSVRADLRGSLNIRLPVIPLGVDSRAFAAPPDPDRRKRCRLPMDLPVVLYLGRLSNRMKADLRPLLGAFAQVPADHRGVLVVAGGVSCAADAADVEQLRERASDLGLADIVQFRPNVSLAERADLLAGADLLVSPPDCLQESFGVVLLEAMASGLPIIAADWNGYREVLDAPACGVLVPTTMPDDLGSISRRAPLEDKSWSYAELSQAVSVDVPALTAALLAFLTDSDARRHAGENGRRRARERYDWSVVIPQHVALWQDLAAAARAAGPLEPSPFWYDHAHVFAQHPTRRLNADTVLRRLTLHQVSQVPPFLSIETLERMLDALSRPTRLGDLPGDAASILRHAAYLLKHGLVEEVRDDA